MGEYDITTKSLVENHTTDWLTMSRMPKGSSVELVDADLSTVMAVPDKLIRVRSPDGDYIGQIDFQAGLDPDLDRRMLVYNVLAGWRHRLPVRTAVFAMRPAALSDRVMGLYRQVFDSRNRLEFEYRIIPVWELPVDQVLAAGIGTLPLAPISAVSEADLPRVIERMKQRIDAELDRPQANELWTATDILMGLRYSEAFAATLLAGVKTMEESVTYQGILRRGEQRGIAVGEQRGIALGERRGRIASLVDVLTARFGPPPSDVRARLDAIDNESELGRLVVAAATVSGWSEFIGRLPGV